MTNPFRRSLSILTLLATVSACGTDVGDGTSIPRPDSTAPTSGTPTDPPTSSEPSITAPPTSEPGARRADLDAARARWADAAPAAYRFTYRPVCFCDPTEHTVDVLGGHTLNGDGAARVWSVEEWFDAIDEAIGTAAHVEATYDEATGHPVSVHIDVDEQVVDEEYGMEAVGLEPVTDAAVTLFTDSYGCGFGFTVAHPDQTAALSVSVAGYGSETADGVHELAELDIAEVTIGRDLMANWCDDVSEPEEPEPVRFETWDIVGGAIAVTVTSDTSATAVLTGVVASTPDGREVALGDIAVTNEMWGFFAG